MGRAMAAKGARLGCLVVKSTGFGDGQTSVSTLTCCLLAVAAWEVTHLLVSLLVNEGK